MLAIRMQRTGRKGHAQFRLVVQDSRFTPTSGRVVANLGSYDPHTKAAQIDKSEAEKFLANGAQPSDRAAQLLQAEGVTMPSWVKTAGQKTRTTRHPEKLRSNQPPQPQETAGAEVVVNESVPSEPAVEQKTEEAAAAIDTDTLDEEKTNK